MIRKTFFAIVLCAIAVTPAAFAQDFPKFSNHVVDAAGVVPDDAERQINAELKDYQERSTNQIAVAVIETLGNASLEDYTNDLFEEWGIGEADKDNGVLLLIAMEERDIRIEPGFGLEGDLTDLESGRIIREIIEPRMRGGDAGDAILQGTHGIRATLGDEDVDQPVPIAEEPRDDGGRNIGGSLFWIIPFLIFGPLSAIGRRGRRRRGWITPIFWGGGFGGGGGSGMGGGGGFGGGGFGGGGGGGSGGGGASGGW